MSSKFLTNKSGDGSITTKMVQQLSVNFARSPISRQAQSAIAMESLDSTQAAELNTALEGLSNVITGTVQGLAKDFGLGFKAGSAESLAAQVGGLLASAPQEALKLRLPSQVATESIDQGVLTKFIPALGGDVVSNRHVAFEAYDERDNKNAVAYSIAYNYQASKQDEAGEANFPTVVVAPDDFGLTLSVRLIELQDDLRHATNGDSVRNFNRRNVLQALVDHTILRGDVSLVVPVYSDDSKKNFVDAALLAPAAIEHEGKSIVTSDLAIGKRFSLLGIAQTAALLQSGGQLSSSDALDPAMKLKWITLKADDQAVRIKSVGAMTAANYTAAPQGNYRKMQLSLDTDQILLTKDMKDVAGAAVDLFALIDTNNLSVYLSTNIHGTTNLDTADHIVNAGEITVNRIVDEDGQVLALDTGLGAQVVTALGALEVVGYRVEARRTNSNRRERGQMVNLNQMNLVYGVPLLGALTVARSLTAGDMSDTSDLQALVTLARIKTSNSAIGKLVEAAEQLRELKAQNGVLRATDVEVMGAGRFLVTPFFDDMELDVKARLDSLNSTDRISDLQALLVNTIRDFGTRMVRDSQYKIAADALAGGMAPNPTVIVTTDPVIANYLMTNGDLRTLGQNLDIKVVSTNDLRVKGKMFLTLGQFGEGRENVPNPLHFGNMAWKPETTLVLPIHREGQNSKELTVHPSFLHVVNCPVMSEITVKNISEVVNSKVAINNHPIP